MYGCEAMMSTGNVSLCLQQLCFPLLDTQSTQGSEKREESMASGYPAAGTVPSALHFYGIFKAFPWVFVVM